MNKVNPLQSDRVQTLLVEDEFPQARLILEVLKEPQMAAFNVDRVIRLHEALEKLQQNTYDLILLDLNLPDSSNLDTLNRITAQVSDIPIVVLTSLDDQNIALEALRAGAQDYVIKGPQMLEVLPRVCRYTVERYRLALEIRLVRELEQRAYVDAVTGLMSRLRFDDTLNQRLKTMRRNGGNFAILYIDLDRFKLINDSLGHGIGDRILCAVAERLAGGIRESDFVARIGGDEFALILDNMSHPRDAAMVAQKLIETLMQPYLIDDRELEIGASIGIAFYPDDCENSEELVRYADLAMYKAKETGGNCYHFYSEQLSEEASRRIVLESNLRKAIDKGELLLHFQPIVHTREKRIITLEALVRWQHPGRGMIPPDHFIPLAEHSNLILNIDNWVMENACRQLKQWQNNGSSELRIAVNCSGQNFIYANITEQVRRILEITGVTSNCLEIEITESTLLADPEKASRILRVLRSMGVRISIDDFGTGYSSLNYLKKLPADSLKIDRSFLENIPDDNKATALVDTIISLARNLDLEVVAEGVETTEQLAWLCSRGCDYVQGYYIAKPSRTPDLHINGLKQCIHS
jgi:diguanylate cyclase (GGDEF)-like protein